MTDHSTPKFSLFGVPCVGVLGKIEILDVEVKLNLKNIVRVKLVLNFHFQLILTVMYRFFGMQMWRWNLLKFGNISSLNGKLEGSL